jgi:hypothetical protein
MEAPLDVHQTAFVQAVALAGVVALGMIGCDTGGQALSVQAVATPSWKAGTRKDQAQLGVFTRQARIENTIPSARETRLPRNP